MSQKRQSEINFFFKKLKTSDENNLSPSDGIENVNVLPTESEPATFSDSCEVDSNSRYDIAFAIEENANLKIRNDPNMLYKYLKETWSPKQNYIFPVYECTGENLANTIVQKLKEIGLSLEFLRGQGYDGGANMSGKYCGVQARILNLQPKAIYTHCASHRLNLTLIKACRDMISKEKYRYFHLVTNGMKITTRNDRSVTKCTFWPKEEEQCRNITHDIAELASYSFYTHLLHFLFT
ncbi:uncharacterized protein LOC112679614 isoform X1 [Sipha flava]|uniref:Uncharacterized protein LOC112679614 isoform X1 n=1 Tax=Sipha flava TaxID=143950 RepID=A0A8B8F3L3_9HEMI|nr:uncharacterized protein LOC112679614 isoform X1 [Sipha flava]